MHTRFFFSVISVLYGKEREGDQEAGGLSFFGLYIIKLLLLGGVWFSGSRVHSCTLLLP